MRGGDEHGHGRGGGRTDGCCLTTRIIGDINCGVGIVNAQSTKALPTGTAQVATLGGLIVGVEADGAWRVDVDRIRGCRLQRAIRQGLADLATDSEVSGQPTMTRGRANTAVLIRNAIGA